MEKTKSKLSENRDEQLAANFGSYTGSEEESIRSMISDTMRSWTRVRCSSVRHMPTYGKRDRAQAKAMLPSPAPASIMAARW